MRFAHPTISDGSISLVAKSGAGAMKPAALTLSGRAVISRASMCAPMLEPMAVTGPSILSATASTSSRQRPTEARAKSPPVSPCAK